MVHATGWAADIPATPLQTPRLIQTHTDACIPALSLYQYISAFRLRKTNGVIMSQCALASGAAVWFHSQQNEETYGLISTTVAAASILTPLSHRRETRRLFSQPETSPSRRKWGTALHSFPPPTAQFNVIQLTARRLTQAVRQSSIFMICEQYRPQIKSECWVSPKDDGQRWAIIYFLKSFLQSFHFGSFI